MYRVTILFGKSGGVVFDGVWEFYIAESFWKPGWCAEVNEIEDEVEAKVLGISKTFIAPRPIELAARGLDDVPGQRVAHPFAAQIAGGPLEIILPEFVVLSPLKLVYSKMRDA
jgi:hypothetical protein